MSNKLFKLSFVDETNEMVTSTVVFTANTYNYD